MGARRSWVAVAIAMAAHAPLALAIARREPVDRPSPRPVDESIVVLEDLPVTAPSAFRTGDAVRPDAPQPSAATPAPRAAGVAPPARGLTDESRGALAAEGVDSSWSIALLREPPRLDLSLPYAYASAPATRENAGAPDVQPRTASDAMRAALDAHDQQLGLGSAGPLIAAVHGAAVASRIRVISTAVLSATTDAEGTVLTVTAEKATGDADAWNEVATNVLQAMRTKKLRVPRGARGMRVALHVESRLRQAGGHMTSDEDRRAHVLVTADKPDVERAPSVALGTPRYRCQEACTASGNIDPTDAALNAANTAKRTIVVRTLSEERLR